MVNYEKEFEYPPTNEDVQTILNLLSTSERAHKELEEQLNKRLENIQSECDHDYLHDGDCGYHAYFKCQKCGKEIEV